MTDRSAPPTRRRPSKRPSPMPVYAATLAVFLGVTGFLGVRVAQGQDPALGAAKPKVAQVVPRKRVIVRKVIVTKHVTVIKPAPVQSSGATRASAPVQTSSAPVQQQTYTPAPAPAPAPAPVQTATS